MNLSACMNYRIYFLISLIATQFFGISKIKNLIAAPIHDSSRQKCNFAIRDKNGNNRFIDTGESSNKKIARNRTNNSTDMRSSQDQERDRFSHSHLERIERTSEEEVEDIKNIKFEYIQFKNFYASHLCYLERLTLTEWREYIYTICSGQNLDRAFELYSCYQFEQFRKYLKNRPDYDQQIIALAQKLKNKSEYNKVFMDPYQKSFSRQMQRWKENELYEYIQQEAEEAKIRIEQQERYKKITLALYQKYEKTWLDESEKLNKAALELPESKQELKDTLHYHIKRLADRAQAIKKSINDPSGRTLKEIELLPKAISLIENEKINIKKFHRTSIAYLQKYVVNELKDLINRIAVINFSDTFVPIPHLASSVITKKIEECLEYCKKGNFEKAWLLIDFSHKAIDCIQFGLQTKSDLSQYVKGVAQGVKKIIPYSLKALKFLPEIIAKVIKIITTYHADIDMNETWVSLTEELQKNIINQDLKSTSLFIEKLNEIISELQFMTGPEFAEEIIAVGGSIFLLERFLQATIIICKKLAPLKFLKKVDLISVEENVLYESKNKIDTTITQLQSAINSINEKIGKEVVDTLAIAKNETEKKE